MKHSFNTPCDRNSCLCASGDAGQPTRVIHAGLEYTAGGEKHCDSIEITVPASFHRGQWLSALTCATRRIITPTGARYGVLKFRLDGSDKLLSVLEVLSDLWYRITWRGTQYTGSHFVPIWPGPIPVPPPAPASAQAALA
ncbi:MAG: hypothetical protein KC777_23010 [Cyanobacteria bacterium HKST-UBA02]|nr:hypothetical protein [Cyanobacteria bacterium HKST-UBA02]